MSAGLKKTILTSLKLGLPLSLFVYLLLSVERSDYQAFWNQPKRWELLILAQFVALTATVLGFLRWRILVLAFDIPFTVRESLRLGFLGYLLNFVSFGSVGGDFFKAILVARDKIEKRPEAIATVLVDRAIGLLGLVLLAWLSLRLLAGEQLNPLLLGIRRGAGLIALAATIALISAVYAGSWFERLIDWIARLPWLGESLARMARAVRLLRSRPTTIPLLLLLAILIHTLLAITIYLISHGIYVDAPSLVDHLVVVPPGMAAGALPLAPGGIGLQEGALAGLLEQLPSLPKNFSGMIVATVYRLITMAIAGIGLIYYLGSHGREFQFVRNASSETA